MSQTKVVKGKARQEKPLKVMHKIENGTITSRTVDPKAPKLREATVDPVQQAEDTAHKPVKTKAKPPEKPASIMTDEQRSVLKALNDLGADKHPIDIAKHLGYTHKGHKYEKAPRSPVRKAMEALSKLHFVTSKKEGIKYSYSITDKGKEALKDKGAHNPAPASTALSGPNHQQSAVKAESKTVSVPPPVGLNEGVLKAVGRVVPAAIQRPANTDKICPKCSVANPYIAVHCKACGALLAETVKAAAPLLAA